MTSVTACHNKIPYPVVAWIKANVFLIAVSTLNVAFSVFSTHVTGNRKNHYLMGTLRFTHPTYNSYGLFGWVARGNRPSKVF